MPTYIIHHSFVILKFINFEKKEKQFNYCFFKQCPTVLYLIIPPHHYVTISKLYLEFENLC